MACYLVGRATKPRDVRSAQSKASAVTCGELFFFSSRRRHTRLQGDWSSDVCSSDLGLATRSTVTTDFIQKRMLREGRVGEPHELVGAAVFLAGDASSLVTGHTLPVDRKSVV